MANVPIFWEFGKFGSSMIAVIALVRRNHFAFPKLPLAYFCVLVPACVLTLTQMEFGEARGFLSSVMSGPFFLVISCWFFSHTKITPPQLRQLFLGIILPLLSVAFATLFFTVSTEEIQFGSESNFATSGGFGPNQVSSMLGLGAFVCLLCLIVFKNPSEISGLSDACGDAFFGPKFIDLLPRRDVQRGGSNNGCSCVAVSGDPASAARRFAPVIGIAVVSF